MVVIYLDNVVVFGDDSEKVQEVTIRVIGRLTVAGFMINVKKCDFLCKEIKMLSFIVSKGTVCIGVK